MNADNNYETEREVLSKDIESTDNSNNQDSENVNLGFERAENKRRKIEISEYLDHLEAQFRPEAIDEEALRKIRFDLQKIDASEIDPRRKGEVSRTLLEVFQNMKAWEAQMNAASDLSGTGNQEKLFRYHGSKDVFEASCAKLYIGLDPSTTLAPSEIIRIDGQIKFITLPETKKKVEQLNGIEAMANTIDLKQRPEEAIEELEKILQPIAEGVQLDLKNSNLGEEEQTQLDLCVQIIYKLQRLIDKIRDSDAYRKQTSYQQELASVGKTEQKEQENAWDIQETNKIWEKYFKENLGTIEEYLTSEVKPSLGALNINARQNEFISQELPKVWDSFHDQSNKRSTEDKIEDSTLRISNILKNVTAMKTEII